MSEMQGYRGKLILSNTPGGNLQEQITFILEENGTPFDENNKYEWTLEEFLFEADDSFYEKYMIHQGKLYEFKDLQELDPYGFLEYEKHEDGSISFMTMFYNGGTCLTEMMRDILEEEL